MLVVLYVASDRCVLGLTGVRLRKVRWCEPQLGAVLFAQFCECFRTKLRAIVADEFGWYAEREENLVLDCRRCRFTTRVNNHIFGKTVDCICFLLSNVAMGQ